MKEDQRKAVGRALFVLSQERNATLTRGAVPPDTEELARARATIEALNGIELLDLLTSNPRLVDDYVAAPR